uniref:Fungal lipase-type domain-containing protein n=1 Tax=Helicotheca tamesis TaxID=374047 RepID=A0A7S2HNK0_9STRA|mmetsp:Transcript_19646/g.26970  ORF Transcript_19646/g.26970 Transcript_19646/m.26970 type:complete len:415 (+) Transcript_19646:171-1415(+)
MKSHIAFVLLLSSVPVVKAVVLDEKIMTLSHNAAILSSLSYDADEQPDGSTHGIVLEDAHYYVSENSPDKAIVANVDGYCYFAFAGSEADVSDWMQNFDPRTEPVYDDDGNSCDAREGFVRAYNAPFKEEAEGALRGCAATCDNPEECVVLTGHSQGGSIANLAAIRFHDLSPYVITFGQAGSVHEPCPQINSEKYYRYINSILDGDELEHDPVPFAPMVGSSFQGYMIIVSPMSDAVASYGLDADVDMTNFHINVFPFQAHRLDEGDYGYLQRMDAIMSHNHYPVPSDGWKIGEPCSDEGECISGRCDNNVCENAMGTCEPCDEDSDCLSGKCRQGQCTRMDLLVDDGCNCLWDSDCVSGRCEGYLDWRCEPKKENGERCNENSDCLSGRCNWWFRCSNGNMDEALPFVQSAY